MKHDEIRRFRQYLRRRGKQRATVDSYARDAQFFLTFLGENGMKPAQAEPATLRHYHRKAAMSVNSQRRAIISIRLFYRFLAAGGRIPESTFDAFPIPPRDEQLPPQLSDQEMGYLMELSLSKGPLIKGHRDAALIALLGYEGLKAAEIIHLAWDDYLQDRDFKTLRVTGPRGRVIVLGPSSEEHLERYRASYGRYEHPRVDRRQGAMFFGFKGRETLTPLPTLSRHGLKFMLSELGEEAGVTRLNSELLRHHAMGHLISRGKELDEIKQHLGLRSAGNIGRHLQARK